jgi:hypothetical protein
MSLLAESGTGHSRITMRSCRQADVRCWQNNFVNLKPSVYSGDVTMSWLSVFCLQAHKQGHEQMAGAAGSTGISAHFSWLILADCAGYSGQAGKKQPRF